jgi:CheY-like chemotaxis protein
MFPSRIHVEAAGQHVDLGLTPTSVDEALQVLQRKSIDVIVSVIAFPGSADGIALIRVIRTMPEPLFRVSAVAVSAHANNDDRTRALRRVATQIRNHTVRERLPNRGKDVEPLPDSR